MKLIFLFVCVCVREREREREREIVFCSASIHPHISDVIWREREQNLSLSRHTNALRQDLSSSSQ